MFGHPDFDGHDRVIHHADPASGLAAIIAIHSTRLGPAFGGCRMHPYVDAAAALTDVLRLSRAMTYKSAICGLPYGGGKSVILADPTTDKTEALLEAMGSFVESLRGAYIVADDVGTTLADLAVMRRRTRHTAAATPSASAPLGVTAHGVLSAMRAAARQVLGAPTLAGLTVSIQGLGNVGAALARALHAECAMLVVADRDGARAAAVAAETGASVVAPAAITAAPADIFAPCALGGILDGAAIGVLPVRIVCGGANNQLATRADSGRLAARGIVYVPDYLASAGGVIDFHQESIDDSPAAVLAAVARIEAITAEVLALANAEGVTPLEAADALVAERLAAGPPH